MSPADRDRRAVLITGGNSGIGLECARRLARAGRHVIIASRDRAASAETVRRLARETGNPAIEELGLDLASSDSVRDLARELDARDVPLHALVCNAGLQFNSGPRLSPDGVELTIAVNHLGHFLLTHLLLERLLAHAPARIWVVSSGVHDPARLTGMPRPEIPDLESLFANGGPRQRGFDGRLAYVNSKLCNLWFTYELIRRLDARGLLEGERPLSVNAFEPGLVPGSGLARDYPAALRLVWDYVLPVLTLFLPQVNTARRSGTALAELVLDPALERVSGKYFPSHTRFREARSSDASYAPERARELWELSVRLTGLSADESPLVSSAAA